MEKVIVVFGGSFNPPTNSHFSLAEQVCSLYAEVEQVLFVPVADGYPKKDLLEAKYRVEMLERVCAKNPNFKVCRVEVDSPQLLNSIETLRAIAKLYPGYELWLTLGSDNLKLMPSWPGYKEILERYKCLVLERNHDLFGEIIDSHKVFKLYRDRLIKMEEMVHSDCNATLLRRNLRQGKSIRYLVPDEVYEYIRQKGLYTIVGTSTQELKCGEKI